MLKIKPVYTECADCDYRYIKGDVSGCIFPDHAPIDTAGKSECNTGEYEDYDVDKDFVQIKNVVEMRIL